MASPAESARVRLPEAAPTELRASAYHSPAAVLKSPALPFLALSDPAEYL
jgi:hypothetical protein